jgi:hypothetical protein
MIIKAGGHTNVWVASYLFKKKTYGLGIPSVSGETLAFPDSQYNL